MQLPVRHLFPDADDRDDRYDDVTGYHSGLSLSFKAVFWCPICPYHTFYDLHCAHTFFDSAYRDGSQIRNKTTNACNDNRKIMMKKKKLFTRRDAIITGLTTVGGLLATGCASRPTPPSYGSLLRMGDNLTYIAHRFLLPGQALVKEYNFRDISSFPATGTTNPADTSKPYYSESYERFQKRIR